VVVPLSRRLILPLLLYFDERLFRLCFAVCGADAQGETRGRESKTAFAEISRRMYEEIRSSRDPRDHVGDG